MVIKIYVCISFFSFKFIYLFCYISIVKYSCSVKQWFKKYKIYKFTLTIQCCHQKNKKQFFSLIFKIINKTDNFPIKVNNLIYKFYILSTTQNLSLILWFVLIVYSDAHFFFLSMCLWFWWYHIKLSKHQKPILMYWYYAGFCEGTKSINSLLVLSKRYQNQ